MSTPSATTNATNRTVPETWPGAFGLYSYSRNAVRTNLWTIIGLYVLSLAISIIFGLAGGNDNPTPRYITATVIGELLSVLVTAASTIAYLASAKGTKISINESLKQGFSIFAKFLIVSVLVLLLIGISFVLLVIPVFFVLPRVVLAPYFLVDKNLGPIDALKASWAASKGHAVKVWGVMGVTILFSLLMLVLVGIYLTVMYSAAFAVLYYLIGNKLAATGPEQP